MSHKDVATLIVAFQGKVLVLKRGPNSTGAGLWNFPGGSVEKDEEFEIAAVRELKEETNLEVGTKNIKYLSTKETKYLHIHHFITDKFSGEVQINSESSEARWTSLEELSKYPFVGGGTLSKDLLAEIENFMEK